MSGPPQVVLDITRLLGRLMKRRLPTGVDRVGLAYIQHFGPRATALVRHGPRSGIFSAQISRQLFDLLTRWSPDDAGRAYRLTWQGIASCIGRDHGFGRLLLNTCHGGLDDGSSERAIRRHRLRPVFMVHDLIPVFHPEFCRAGEEQRHQARIERMLLSCHGIVTNSHATLADVRSFASERALAGVPSIVAHLAPAVGTPADRLSDRTPISPRPYFLALGTIEPRKNHLTLLQAWQRLAATLGAATPQLLIVGQRGWESENVDDLLERSRALRGHVTVLSHCNDTDLWGWMSGARALLFPSFAEGYGMPVIEALAAGVPVIASDLPVLKEIVGSVPDYLDPLDTPAWIARIADYARDDSVHRAAQLNRMRGFKVPTWQLHFERVDRFLEEIDARP